MKSTASASGDLLGLLLSYLSSRGLEPREVIQAAGIDAASLTNRELRIPFEQVESLLRQAADACADPDLGLHFGELARRFPSGHLLYVVMMNSPDVAGALERFFRFHALMSDVLIPRLERAGEHAEILIEPAQPGFAIGRPYIDTSLAACAVFLEKLGGKPVRPIEVRFAYPAPADTTEHRRLFACPLRFDQPVSRLRLDSHLLDRSLQHADQELLKSLEQMAQRRLVRTSAPPGWATKTQRSILRTLLGGSRPAVETVARDLAVSVRQLQGRLKAEETTYKQVLDAVRLDLAKDYLQKDELSLCEVSFLLGYAEQSSFNHAFKRWTGVTPMEYRGGR
jgi:AraC-like DNA-binding protein